MKKLYTLFFIFLVSFANAQNYNNEWITFPSTQQYSLQQYFKISVWKEGIYRLTYTDLDFAQVPVNGIWTDPSRFQIFHNGVEQFIDVNDANTNNVFDTGDYLEFYGKRNDGTLDTRLYDSVSSQPNPYYSLFNDTAAYFLTYNLLNTNNKRIVLETDVNLNGYTAEPTFISEEIQNYTMDFNPGYQDDFEVADNSFTESEGWVSIYGITSIDKPFTIHKYLPGGSLPTVETTINGYNRNLHPFKILSNGTDILTDTINAYHQKKYTIGISNLPSNGTTTLTFSPQNDLTNLSNPNYTGIAYFKLRYPRSFDFTGESAPQHLFLSGNSNKIMLDITNFSTTQPVLYVFDDTLRKIQLDITATDIRALIPAYASERFCYLTDASLTYSPAGNLIISPVSTDPSHFARFNNFLVQGNNKDYLIVSNKRVWDGAQLYADYRLQSGHTPLLADVDEIYDQFAWGINKHHIAIRNFCDQQIDNNQPKYLFLLGKSIMYNNAHSGVGYDLNLVPTFGEPASDNMYTANLNTNTFKPELATGRLAAQNDSDVIAYLNKMKEFELAHQDTFPNQPPPLWMKNVLHFGGGSDISEQNYLSLFLSQYRDIIEDTLFGGHVTTFLKSSTEPIEVNQSKYLQDLIDGGCSMMTFFGHAAGSSFDIATDAPENYHNKGRYPLILANSCFVGDIHGVTRKLNERFVLTPDKAAIAFMAVPDKGLAEDLHPYSLEFHKVLFQQLYGSSLGVCMQKTIENILFTSPGLKAVAMNMTLHGDPALVLNSFPKAEYSVSEPEIFFNPPNVTTELDSFEMKIVLTNTGAAHYQNFRTLISQTLPSGNILPNIFITLDHITYKDTLTIKLPVDFKTAAGLNTFQVIVDVDNNVPEYDESINNVANAQLLINSTDINPVYPSEFAIIPTNNIQLKATTANLFAPPRTYRFQVDTTDKFINPLQNATVPNASGVVKFQIPFLLDNDRVYYWRVANDSITSNDTTVSKKFQWKNSSFIYKPNITGWSQAHFNQFKNDDYTNIVYDDSIKHFRFVTDSNSLQVNNFYHPDVGFEPGYLINGSLIEYGGCTREPSIHLAVIDSIDNNYFWNNRDQHLGQFNTYDPVTGIHTCNRPRYEGYFIFRAYDAAAIDSLVDALTNDIPIGDYIVIWNAEAVDYSQMNSSLFNVMTQMGANMNTVQDKDLMIFFTQKGHPNRTQLLLGDSINSSISLYTTLGSVWDKGFIKTKQIGPATQWQSMHWNYHSLETNSADSIALQIYGVTSSGQEVKLIDSITPPTFDVLNLNTIADANIYPYLKLKAYKQDESLNRTPPQLDKWQIYYQPVPEGTLNTSYYSLYKDTVQEGETVTMSMAFENISNIPMDTLLVDYFLYDQNNNKHTIASKRLHRALPAGDTIMTSVSFSSLGYLGNNKLWIEANPHNDQPEQYHFNNFASVNIHVNKDVTNPLMDVTFDGVHILNGDIVSAKPEIIIQLNDENRYLALNDTSNFRVSLKSPVGVLSYLYFESAPNISTDKTKLKWTPASLPKNSFRIAYSPERLEDGIYELDVEATDASGNQSGRNHYRITFEIINRSTITEVVNYPNPFSTSTRFVFVLTGSEIPEQMKIRIMTITGKVVREITREELGHLHIGRNITDYAWDGKDEFGDQLANGVYLYQVQTRLHEEKIEHRETLADSYFKKGWGKMYLMR